MPKHLAIYCRASSKAQKLDSQLPDLKSSGSKLKSRDAISATRPVHPTRFFSARQSAHSSNMRRASPENPVA
ncbi:hypothetical protein PLANPX_2796 [Lacipirellula parvula]|uniref:Resolvase/invertase-type recombinase catalytic domain-containing protein n=1 Tax=Lacipirellula parvula TaxID=2650471 RepID=A0A5K7X8Q9_9BACT|nr:hypothetical protein PLANPX_2796 [Lacipirellula parvula]